MINNSQSSINVTGRGRKQAGRAKTRASHAREPRGEAGQGKTRARIWPETRVPVPPVETQPGLGLKHVKPGWVWVSYLWNPVGFGFTQKLRRLGLGLLKFLRAPGKTRVTRAPGKPGSGHWRTLMSH